MNRPVHTNTHTHSTLTLESDYTFPHWGGTFPWTASPILHSIALIIWVYSSFRCLSQLVQQLTLNELISLAISKKLYVVWGILKFLSYPFALHLYFGPEFCYYKQRERFRSLVSSIMNSRVCRRFVFFLVQWSSASDMDSCLLPWWELQGVLSSVKVTHIMVSDVFLNIHSLSHYEMRVSRDWPQKLSHSSIAMLYHFHCLNLKIIYRWVVLVTLLHIHLSVCWVLLSVFLIAQSRFSLIPEWGVGLDGKSCLYIIFYIA